MNKLKLWLQHTPPILLVIYGMAVYVLFTSIYNLAWGMFFYDPTLPVAPGEEAVGPFYELGTSLGFWGTIFLCLNFVLATRWRWLERLFDGLDKNLSENSLPDKFRDSLSFRATARNLPTCAQDFSPLRGSK